MITMPDFLKKQTLFVFFNEGEKMSILHDNLIVKDKDGKTKLQCTCYRLFIVFAVGNCTFTSVVIQRAIKFGFFIVCLTSGFRLYSVIGAAKDGNTLLKQKQYAYKGVDIGRKIVYNKIVNQREVLKNVRHKSDALKEGIGMLDGYIASLKETKKTDEIMAYEGLSAKVYFRNHFNNVVWNGRQPRLKNDYVNSALDVGYTILFSFVDSLLECYGFDTYIGFLHRQFYMRKSLVCDMVEPFRVLIDMQLKKGINLRQIKEDDFILINHQWRLRYENSAKYVRLFATPLLDNKDEIFRYISSFYCAFMKDVPADKLPLFLIGDEQ